MPPKNKELDKPSGLLPEEQKFVSLILAGTQPGNALAKSWPHTAKWTPAVRNAVAEQRTTMNKRIKDAIHSARRVPAMPRAIIRAEYLEDLRAMVMTCLGMNQPGAAVRALELYGKAAGLYHDVLEIRRPRTEAEIEAELAEVTKQLAEEGFAVIDVASKTLEEDGSEGEQTK